MDTKPRPGRRRAGGGAELTGLAMALFMAARVLVPLLRNLGPAPRHLALGLLIVGIPGVFATRAWHNHREEKRSAEALRLRARGRRSRAAESRTDADTPGEDAPKPPPE